MLLSTSGELTPSQASSVEVGSCGGPTVPLCPPPWALQGNGLVLVTRAPLSQLQADAAIPTGIRSSLKAPLNIIMLVNYAHSDCGPYQELLFIPGTTQIAGRRLPTISNIFVSTESSVVNGRLNWGIPKYRCQFRWGMDEQGRTRITASQHGKAFFDVAYETGGLKMPVNTAWVPGFLKTLGQEWEGRQFVFSPSASGHARRAKIRHLDVAAGEFPVISASQILAAFEITDFNMEFPVPQIL